MRLKLTIMILIGFTSSLFAQEAVILGTGLSDKTYSEAKHVSTVPVVVPASGVNTRGVSLDVTNLTDSKTCVTLSLEESFDGGTTKGGAGAIQVCGQPGGFKDKAGNPLSSIGFDGFTSNGIPANTQLFSTLEILGTPLKTNSAIKVKEVK